MATLALNAGLCCRRFCFNFLLLLSFLILEAEFYLNNLSSFWGPPHYENWNFNECISILYLAPPGLDIDDTAVGHFYPAKLLAHLKRRKLNWGILTDGARWRLYSTRSSRPYEDYVELPLAETLESADEAEYGLFERFFHKGSFIVHPTTTIPEVKRTESKDSDENQQRESSSIKKCPLDQDRDK
ncbi:MAG: hypothetical protein Q8N90_00065, partial [bacterium]|nr:hypothetical protein [bacterium]